MSHANALLTPRGRLALARCVVEDGWPLRRAAERFQVSATTAARWATRYRDQGPAAMVDRSSRPRTSLRRTSTRQERRILALRVTRRWGPARIAYRLGMHPSTVHKVLTRYRLPRLAWADRATGRTVRRYEHTAPGDLVHVDIKKLGRIPDGGGHKVHGRADGRRSRTRGLGYAYLHNAVDDHSRLAYTEILTDEQGTTAAAFWTRARAYFASCGISVCRVLTDNGACYRSRAFAAALSAGAITHKRTRPYQPQTNGKVERFNRTLLEEWAYARPYSCEDERAGALPGWLHTYNHHRGHTALGGACPADRVTNLRGQYTYGPAAVLRGVDLDVAEHEVVTLIGASGSGKSTLLRCVDLLERVDDGQVWLDGQDVTDPRADADAVRRRIGVVFQSYNLFPHLSVLDNVTLAPRRVHGVERARAEDEARALLERIGLGGRAGAYPDQLSGGQGQRVAIARALAVAPRLLLLDEVTSALDPELVGEVLELVREVSAGGMTILMATHEMGFARQVAHRVAFLEQGSLLEVGPPEQVLGDPVHERTRRFLRRVVDAGRL